MNTIIVKVQIILKIKYYLMSQGTSTLCNGEVAWLSYFQIFCFNDNLDLRSHGNLLSLFDVLLYPYQMCIIKVYLLKYYFEGNLIYKLYGIIDNQSLIH